MSVLKVRMLGSFEVKYGESVVQISGRPACSLFAYLVLNGGISHRREKLAAVLWPDSPDITARENLRHTLWRIRKTFSFLPSVEYFATNDIEVSFNTAAAYWLDVEVLKTAKDCRSADGLISTLAVYQGELLPGFYEEWVALEREYLNSVFEHNMARLMSMLRADGRWLDILDWGERWLAFGQRPEPAYRALMVAHMEMGEMSKVADVYLRCVRALKEIGLDPSFETRELYENLKIGRGQAG